MEKENVVIRFENVSFKYNEDKVILDNVNFNIRRNSKITIMGQNGAGKSTLFKLLTGQLQPQIGQIHRDIKSSVAIAEQMIKQDKLDLALFHFQSSNDLASQLYKDIPHNPRFIKMLALSHQKLGDIYHLQNSRDKHNYTKALNYYKRCTELFDNLGKNKSIFPHADLYKTDLAISYNKLGQAYLSLNILDKALIKFKKKINQSRKIVFSFTLF